MASRAPHDPVGPDDGATAARRVDRAAQPDDRQVGVQAGRGADVDRLDEDDAVDALLGERLGGDCAPLPLLGGRQRERVPGPSHGRLQAEEQGRRAVQRGAEGDDADPAIAAQQEGAGSGVGAVVQFTDGPQDAVAHLGTDVRLAVDDPRHRLLRDAGRAGDLRHPGTATGSARRHGGAPIGAVATQPGRSTTSRGPA